MTRVVLPVSASLVLALSLACAGDEPTGPFVLVDSSMVASATVVPNIDPTRTYEYDFPTVRSDSVLVALWTEGLPLTQAWRPVAYVCFDALGPRLTVELATPDSRIESHDFRLGTGRLACSHDLWQYTLGPLDPQAFELDATVQFVNLEGGCWALVADATTRYEPIGLPSEFRVDGLRVRATLRHRPDMASICMIAPLAEVLSISRR